MVESMKQDMEFRFEPSTRKHKKYMAVFEDGRKVHVGDKCYQQFRDSALGLYSKLDHKDKERRRRYLACHGDGKKYSAKLFAEKFLW